MTNVIADTRRERRYPDRRGVDLGDIVRERLKYWEVLTHAQQRRLDIRLYPDRLPVAVNRRDLEELVDVLLGNVLRHAAPGATARVTTRIRHTRRRPSHRRRRGRRIRHEDCRHGDAAVGAVSTSRAGSRKVPAGASRSVAAISAAPESTSVWARRNPDEGRDRAHASAARATRPSNLKPLLSRRQMNCPTLPSGTSGTDNATRQLPEPEVHRAAHENHDSCVRRIDCLRRGRRHACRRGGVPLAGARIRCRSFCERRTGSRPRDRATRSRSRRSRSSELALSPTSSTDRRPAAPHRCLRLPPATSRNPSHPRCRRSPRPPDRRHRNRRWPRTTTAQNATADRESGPALGHPRPCRPGARGVINERRQPRARGPAAAPQGCRITRRGHRPRARAPCWASSVQSVRIRCPRHRRRAARRELCLQPRCRFERVRRPHRPRSCGGSYTASLSSLILRSSRPRRAAGPAPGNRRMPRRRSPRRSRPPRRRRFPLPPRHLPPRLRPHRPHPLRRARGPSVRSRDRAVQHPPVQGHGLDRRARDRR